MIGLTIRKAKRFLYDPTFRFNYFARHGFFKTMPDEEFLEKKFKAKMGYDLDLIHPRTFNEKIQWLKLHDRKPIYATMVDKYEAKEYVASIIGEEHIIPTLGVWDQFEEIDFRDLPNQFVLKCTHDSGGIAIIKDKRQMDYSAVRTKINRSLKRDYFYVAREWPYKSIKHRIIAEKLMVDESGDDLRDYKVLCFNGEPKLIEYHQGRFTDHQTQDFYDIRWNLTPISQTGNIRYQRGKEVAPPPKTLDRMLALSSKLAKNTALLRVDWYSIDKELYFGELTLYDGGGFVPFDNPDDDLMLGSWIALP